MLVSLSEDVPPAIAYVAAFRTYTWDDGVAELARRFFAATPTARQVVLADETRGSLNIEGYEVISHTDDTSPLALPKMPADCSLWFNVDYGLYILRDALPDFDYYLTSESDLAVNLSLTSMISEVARQKIDIVAHEVKLSTPDWHWHCNGASVFNPSWRSLLFFMLLSARAVDLLCETRRRHGREYAAGRMLTWPFCEPFVPSVLKQAEMRFAEVGDFVDASNLKFRPRLPLDDARANVPGSLAHSVLATSSYIRAVIADFGPSDWFTTNSRLKEALLTQDIKDYAPILKRWYAEDHDHAALQAFCTEMSLVNATAEASADLAFCKPALSSSTSQWSHFADPQKDAAGAISVHEFDDFGFHTALETDPWWLVDLIDQCAVDEVAIVNRLTFPCRFRQFRLDSSIDGSTWINRHIKIDMADVSSVRSAPHRIRFADPFIARFVKITLLGLGMLHLRRVSVSGRRLVHS